MLLPTPICLEPDVQYSVDVYFSQPLQGGSHAPSHILVDSVSITELWGWVPPSKLSSVIVLLFDSSEMFLQKYEYKCIYFSTKIICSLQKSPNSNYKSYAFATPITICSALHIVNNSTVVLQSQQLYKVGAVLFLIYRRRTEAQGHRVSEWGVRNQSEPDCLIPESLLWATTVYS